MYLQCQHQLDHHVVHPSFHHRHHLACQGLMPGLLRHIGETLKQNFETFTESWSLKVMGKDQENSSKKFCIK